MMVLHLDVEQGILARYIVGEHDQDPDGSQIVRCSVLRRNTQLDDEIISYEATTVEQATATIASIAAISGTDAANALLCSQPRFQEQWDELTIKAFPLEEKRPTVTTALARAMDLSRTLAGGYAEVIDDTTAEVIDAYRNGYGVDPVSDHPQQAH